jgi:hypothetical protein
MTISKMIQKFGQKISLKNSENGVFLLNFVEFSNPKMCFYFSGNGVN